MERAFGKQMDSERCPVEARLNAREPVQRSLCSAGAARRRNWGVQAREMASQNETQTWNTGFHHISLRKHALTGIERQKWTMSDFTF